MTDRESSITGDDTGEDLYHDLPAFQYDEQIAQVRLTYKQSCTFFLFKGTTSDYIYLDESFSS